jgi:hypothetical protein
LDQRSLGRVAQVSYSIFHPESFIFDLLKNLELFGFSWELNSVLQGRSYIFVYRIICKILHFLRQKIAVGVGSREASASKTFGNIY